MEPGGEATGGGHPGWHTGRVGCGGTTSGSHSDGTHRWDMGHLHAVPRAPSPPCVNIPMLKLSGLLCISQLELHNTHCSCQHAFNKKYIYIGPQGLERLAQATCANSVLAHMLGGPHCL